VADIAKTALVTRRRPNPSLASERPPAASTPVLWVAECRRAEAPMLNARSRARRIILGMRYLIAKCSPCRESKMLPDSITPAVLMSVWPPSNRRQFTVQRLARLRYAADMSAAISPALREGKVRLAQFIAVTWLNADRLAHP
jgi:hypothetical protein